MLTPWPAPSERPPRPPRTGSRRWWSGPERLLAERAIAAVLARARAERAGSRDRPGVRAAAGPGSTGRADQPLAVLDPKRAVVLDDLAELPERPRRSGGGAGQAGRRRPRPGVGAQRRRTQQEAVDAIKATEAELVECPSVKSWELPQFVAREVRRLGGSATARRRPCWSKRSGTTCARCGRGCRPAAGRQRDGLDQRRPGAALLRWPGRGDQLRRRGRDPGRTDRRGHGAAALGAVHRSGSGAGDQCLRLGRARPRPLDRRSRTGCARAIWPARSASRPGS